MVGQARANYTSALYRELAFQAEGMRQATGRRGVRRFFHSLSRSARFPSTVQARRLTASRLSVFTLSPDLRPAVAALQPPGCNSRLRSTEPAAFFPAFGWSSWATLETLLTCRLTVFPLAADSFLSLFFLSNGSSNDFLDARLGLTQTLCLGISARHVL